jgi:hypothetical protein
MCYVLYRFGFILSGIFVLNSCQNEDSRVDTANVDSSLLSSTSTNSAVTTGERISYDKHVRPILSDKCFLCHGPDKANNKAGLRLDSAEYAYAALEKSKGKAIIPGLAEDSLAIQRIYTTDPDEIMPPPDSHLALSEKEKQILSDWVNQGAVYEKHWAFTTPPELIPVPSTSKSNPNWAKNPIDHFVLATLEKEGLKPSPEASPERWLRRVTFDLTGLPPTQMELDDFLKDSSQVGKEKVVTRLMDSKSFGERMATPWLDVARYADSFGYQADTSTKAWPYRDWVIDAFNQNMRFDQFITEQLAGDLLPEPKHSQRLATAFNRIHRKTNEGGSIPEEFRQDGISDRIHTVGTAFLALTMECSRCHDHKYDPITAKDYYSMGAFFNSIDEFGLIQGGSDRGVITPQPALLLPSKDQEKSLSELQEQIRILENQWTDHVSRPVDAKQLVTDAQFPMPELAAKFLFDDTKDAKLKNEVDSAFSGNLNGNQLTSGIRGKALLANGDSLAELPDLNIKHADQAFSFSLWINPAKHYKRAVVFANTTSFDVPFSGYELLIENGHLTWTLARELPGCGASISSLEKIPLNTWTHVTVTNDGSRKASGLRIYINGKLANVKVQNDNLTRDFLASSKLIFSARGRDIGMKDGMIDEVNIFTRNITEFESKALMTGSKLAEIDATPEQLKDYYHSAIDPKARELQVELNRLRAAYRDVEKNIEEIVTMRESKEPVPAYILERGDYTAPTGDPLPRETPSWLSPFPKDQPRNRLGFAKWLTAPDHPLTARVTINRLWQEVFGRGLVATSENFGLQGEHPSHPELLDWLARDFINGGWNYKRAVRQMVLSATYAQDSTVSPELRERDPDNALLARGPSKRLTAEQLRDSALAHSGLLEKTIGGPPVKPYQAAGSMWKSLNNFLPEYTQDKGAGLYRRSLYTFWRRTTTPPNMMVFDASARDVCATRRQTTNTPLQPLVMLNDPQFVEAARKFGERILKEGGTTDAAKARWAFREITGRELNSKEDKILVSLLEEQRKTFSSGSSDPSLLLKVGDSMANPDLDPIELATASALGQALLNLDASITLR